MTKVKVRQHGANVYTVTALGRRKITPFSGEVGVYIAEWPASCLHCGTPFQNNETVIFDTMWRSRYKVKCKKIWVGDAYCLACAKY
jgi:hypothetical protein